MTDDLREREGRSFELLVHSIHLVNGQEITGIVPIYTGKNLIKGKSLWELATLVNNAVGTEGSCIDYVSGVVNKLSKLCIDDPHIVEFWQIVKHVEDNAA